MSLKAGDLVRFSQSYKWLGTYLVISEPYTTERRTAARMGAGIVVLVDGEPRHVGTRDCEKVQ